MPNAFIPDPSFSKDAAADDEIRAGLVGKAQEIAALADANARAVGAPWMPRSGHELIEVEDDGENVFVVNTDHGGHLQEFGSANNPVHAPLRRAALAAGLDIDESVED